MLNWLRIRFTSRNDTSAGSANTGDTNTDLSNSGISQWIKNRWRSWRNARNERDVFNSYRAIYGSDTRLHWWERLRAGIALLAIVSLLGIGLTLFVGVFFVGMTILLETLV